VPRDYDGEYELGLLLRFNEDSFVGDRVFNIEARPVRIYNGRKIRNPETDCPLVNLVISAVQNARDARDIREPEYSYGWEVAYRDVYKIGYARAQRMVATLHKVSNGLAKLERDMGAPQTFGDYMARVAKVLGVKRTAWPTRENPNVSYDQNEYQFGTVGDGVGIVRNRMIEWGSKRREEAGFGAA